MTVGLATATANSILNALCRGTSWSLAAVWVKLHVGDPGGAGTSNAAVETTRKQATFGSVASGASIANTVAVGWTSVAGAERYTHFSAWDAATNGTFQFSGTISASGTEAVGDDFTIAIGSLTCTLPVAA